MPTSSSSLATETIPAIDTIPDSENLTVSNHVDKLTNITQNMEITDEELLTEWPDEEFDFKNSFQEDNLSCQESSSIEDQCTEIEKELEMKRRQISEYHKHQEEVEKLKSAILIWENGCRNALSELQKRIQPPQDVATIFRHLNIPLDLNL